MSLDAEVTLRRPGQTSFRVRVFDASCHGCKVEFVDRPKLDDRAWVKFEGLEALEAVVCWIDGYVGGLEFAKAVHPAVFSRIICGSEQ